MKLQIVLEPSEEGDYTAIVPALPGCLSEGDSREEALANLQESIALYREPLEDLEDVQIVEERLRNAGRRWTLDQVERELGLDD